ncbi:CCHC-type domain-containing protein [Trichonephila clavipes]|nr:CCHC-type domain-containing protein [Trichonephila clavipes]
MEVTYVEKRTYIKIAVLRGRNAMKCHSELVEALGNNILPYRTVARWVGKFQQGRNAKRRVSAKRNYQFRGNRSTIKHTKNSSATSTNASSSKIKISAVFDEEIAEYQRKPLTGNRIIDMEVLLNLLLQLCCPRCFEEGILLSEDSTYGLCSNFVIRCKHCDFYSGFSSSKKTLNCPEGFISVKDTYGKDSVTKYECIGHVQKRVDARLRKLKSKNKNLSGKGKLTDSFIDRMQNYYGIAVRSNVGNLSGLQQNVIAALFHCSSSVEKPMHGQCPIGKDSWCYYQRALSCGKKAKRKI